MFPLIRDSQLKSDGGRKIFLKSKGPELRSFYPDHGVFLSNKYAESNFEILRATLKASEDHTWHVVRACLNRQWGTFYLLMAKFFVT